MPRPELVVEWPAGKDLRLWLGPDAVGTITDTTLLDALVDDATASMLTRLDPAKLPDDENECPRDVHRAIVIDAARLLYRRQSPHGAAVWNEVAIRLREDPDVESRIEPYEYGPEP